MVTVALLSYICVPGMLPSYLQASKTSSLHDSKSSPWPSAHLLYYCNECCAGTTEEPLGAMAEETINSLSTGTQQPSGTTYVHPCWMWCKCGSSSPDAWQHTTSPLQCIHLSSPKALSGECTIRLHNFRPSNYVPAIPSIPGSNCRRRGFMTSAAPDVRNPVPDCHRQPPPAWPLVLRLDVSAGREGRAYKCRLRRKQRHCIPHLHIALGRHHLGLFFKCTDPSLCFNGATDGCLQDTL